MEGRPICNRVPCVGDLFSARRPCSFGQWRWVSPQWRHSLLHHLGAHWQRTGCIGPLWRWRHKGGRVLNSWSLQTSSRHHQEGKIELLPLPCKNLALWRANLGLFVHKLKKKQPKALKSSRWDKVNQVKQRDGALCSHSYPARYGSLLFVLICDTVSTTVVETRHFQ